MEIRALTGFDKATREQYGRSYTPLNGGNTLLGNVASNISPEQQAKLMEKFNLKSTPNFQAVETFTATVDPNAPRAATAPSLQKQNFFEKYKKPLIAVGGIVAAYLIYKRFK